MSDLDDSLGILASWLDRQSIPYMVIGGFAVTVWGEPRMTRALNVTVSVPPEKLSATIQTVGSQFISLVNNPIAFVSETRVFPILVHEVPVDLIFAGLPYEEEAIARAKTIQLKSGTVRICSPEDLILHKIVSPRERDREDIQGVFRYRRATLDFDYLDPRVEELADALADQTMLDWYRQLRKRWS